MRVIITGCEYTGKTTLIEELHQWSGEMGIRFHLDDHFTIPETQHLNEADQEAMLALSPVLKERFQRFQAQYHVHVMHRNEHILLAGYDIEEAVYGPLYYYGQSPYYIRQLETEMPSDTILVLLTARPEVIRKWMTEAPHPHTIIKEQDIPMLLDRFQGEFSQSLLRKKIRIDTSDLTPKALLQEFLTAAEPHLNEKDLLRFLMRRLSRDSRKL